MTDTATTTTTTTITTITTSTITTITATTTSTGKWHNAVILQYAVFHFKHKRPCMWGNRQLS